MTLDQVVIIGAGVSGVAAALAFCQIGVPVSIYELKDGPATIGGALNLTPNALRYMDSWGVLTRLQARGYQVSNIDTFSMLDGTKTSRLSYVDSDNKPKYGYRVMRILRKDLQVAMLETLEAFGVKVAFNKKLSGISETVQGVRATFSDGTNVDAQLLVGCDGIHSRTRTTFVEPGREPIFTNKAIAMGLIDASTLTEEIHFEDTSVNMSQIGSLIASYCDRERKQIFFGSILSVKGEQSRDGWRVRGADQEQLKKDIEATFKGAQPPCLIEMIQKVNDLSLYPIYKLPPGGKWSRGAVILLGDAVHAMPPQGESVGYCLEDVALFTEVLKSLQDSTQLSQAFQRFETLRKPRIEALAKMTAAGFDGMGDISWIKFKLREWGMPLSMWLTQSKRDAEYSSDVRTLVD